MSGMKLAPVIEALHGARGDRVVIPTMSTVHAWSQHPAHPLDFIYLPSSMGQVTALGLGIAMARPERGVVVLSGDGSLLMNLGSLVTIATEAPENLTVVLVDNGVYGVTGGQPTPAGPGVDYAMVARGSGFASVHTFDDEARWAAAVAEVLAEPGPTFVWLKIEADPDAPGAQSPGPARERAAAFRRALAGEG